MDTGIKVGDCMKATLVTIDEDASIVDAAKKMKGKKVSCLLVTDSSGKCERIVTESDLVKKALATEKLSVKVKNVANQPLITISAGADITAAAKQMGKENVRRLIVLDRQDIVGIISAKEVMRISPSLYDLIAEQEHYATEAMA